MRRAVGIIVVAGALLGATPAHAASVNGSGSDPVDPGLPGGRDIVRVTATYDDAGAASATITLREAPSAAADGFAVVTFGRGAGCAGSFLVGAFLDPASTEAAWSDGSASGNGTKSAAGATITIGATDAALGGWSPDCVTAKVVDRTNTANAFDVLDAPAGLAAPPPPPAPPAPTPTPEPTPQPAPRVAKLAVKPGKLAPVKRGKRVKARVTVRNTGTATARNVRLRISAPKALAVTPRSVGLKSIAAGRARTIVLHLKAKRAAKVSLAATAAGVAAARGALTLKLKTKKRKPKPKPGAALAGRYYTHVTITGVGPNLWTAVRFLDGKWAFRGIPEEGGMPTCTQRTAGVDEDGDPTPGCVPYAYDAKRRTLTIDGQPARLDADLTGFTLGEDEYDWSPLIKAGTRFEAPMKSIIIVGYWPYQSVTEKWFTFSKDGHFALTSQSFGSFGIPGGIAPYTQWAAIPPDQRGSYAFTARGELRLVYADGKVDIRPVGIVRDSKTGSADIVKDGFLFGDEQVWLDDEDD